MDSRDQQTWVAASVNNALHDYAAEVPSYGISNIPTNIRFHVTNRPFSTYSPMRNQSYSAVSLGVAGAGILIPLLSQSPWWPVGTFFAIVAVIIDLVNQAATYDMMFKWEGMPSDIIRFYVYNNMAQGSVSLYGGNSWYDKYVGAIEDIHDDPEETHYYGRPSDNNSEYVELVISNAYPLAFQLIDDKYGLNHSRPIDQSNAEAERWINFAERYTYWNENHTYIPAGLIFDLVDENGVYPLSLSAEDPMVTDSVHHFTYGNIYDILSIGINTIDDFKTELWNTYGIASGVSESDYDALWASYGY